jgi:hypothetical protein
VPGPAISIPSNVSADFIRLIDDVESAYLRRIGTEEDRMLTAAITDPTLSQLEWQAVSIALRDAAQCGCGASGTGPVRRFYRAVTGSKDLNRLADPKLEAVRSFVCETNRQRRIAERHVPALLAHGFTDRQVNALALLSA